MILAALVISHTLSSGPTEQQRAVHALERLAFGARPGDAERIARMGVDRWIEQQLHPERISDALLDARLGHYETLSMTDDQIVARYFAPVLAARKAKSDDKKEMLRDIPQDQKPRIPMEQLQAQRVLRAAESEKQLNEVMADFWLNHFNVFAGKGIDRYLLTSYERDVIRPNMWGHFEDLLLATAKSPAMLFYLDNARSRGGALNENYAREIMELHTLGVSGGYTQQDVTELARVFTGWTIARPREGGGFVFRRGMHDRGAKTVLGNRIGANGGMEEGERMIHFLALHPATAHHIAYQLCQRLVDDHPSDALVARVAHVFLDSRGDLRKTVAAVIASPEFWNAKDTKVKSPFEYAVSAIRAVDGHIDDPLPVARALQQLGEPLYGAQPPTGYSDTADAWNNTGALLNRMNFAIALTNNKVPGVHVTIPPDATFEKLEASITAGTLTDKTKSTIRAKQPLDAATVAGLILGSPEFQRK